MKTILALLVLSVASLASEVKLNYPGNGTVIQQDGTGNASIPIAIRVHGTASETVNCDVTFEDRATLATTVFSYSVSHVPNGTTKESQTMVTATMPVGDYEVTVSRSGVTDDTIPHVCVGGVYLVLGQSNGTNHCNVRYSTPPAQAVFAFNPSIKGWRRCDDPLPFAADTDGSAWPQVASALSAYYGIPIGIISAGVGDSSVGEWVSGQPDYTNRVLVAFNALKFPVVNNTTFSVSGPYIKAVLWIQGEKNCQLGTDQTTYYTKLSSIISSSRTTFGDANLPWFVANTTYQNGVTSAPIRAAQQQTWLLSNVFAGPDTDTLGSIDRYDNVHMNQLGNPLHAQMWINAITTAFP